MADPIAHALESGTNVVLSPGFYLVELALAREASPAAVAAALESLGWCSVVVDPFAADPRWLDVSDWGSSDLQALDDTHHNHHLFRLLARLDVHFEPKSSPGLRWLYVEEVPFDPFGPKREKLFPFELFPDRTYALRFTSRWRGAKERPDVKAALAEMGFDVLKLSELQRNTREPGRPNVSVSMWYATGRWTKGESLVIEEDPFFVQNLVEIGAPMTVEPELVAESQPEIHS